MTNKFDELAKGLAQSGTRRQALKKLGVGLASTALACFGLANRAEAKKKPPQTCVPGGGVCSSKIGSLPCCPGSGCCIAPGATSGVCTIGCGL
jgi:hypothetical protein